MADIMPVVHVSVADVNTVTRFDVVSRIDITMDVNVMRYIHIVVLHPHQAENH
jgi:hypothetical protein